MGREEFEVVMEKSVKADVEAAADVSTTRFENEERTDLEHQRQLRNEVLAGRTQDRKERKDIGRRLLMLVQGWLIGVFLLLFSQGFGSKFEFFELSEPVLNTLLVTTTANLIGLLYVVAKYLYHEKRIDS